MELRSSVLTLTESPPSLQSTPPKKSSSKTMRIALVVAIVCAIAFIVATGFLGERVSVGLVELNEIKDNLKTLKESLNVLTQKKEVCNTKECIVAAAELMESMDLKADPCQDFFQFACGGWIEKNSIPESKSRWNNFDILDDEVNTDLKDILRMENGIEDSNAINSTRNMYIACMDTDTIEKLGLSPLIDLLNFYGGWPMTNINWTDSDDTDWRSMSSSIRASFGISALVNIYNYLDSNNTDQSSIYIDQGSLGLPRSTLINAETDSTAVIMNAYSEFTSKVARIIRDAINGGTNDSTIEYDVRQMISFEIALAKIMTPPEERRNETRMYNPQTVSDLQAWTDMVEPVQNHSYINWSEYINHIYSEANVFVPSDEQIIVNEPNYLLKLVRLLNATDPRVIVNYLNWRLVLKFGGETNQQIGKIAYDFYKIYYGTSSPQPRWQWCVRKVNDYLGFAVSALFIEKSFDETSKLEAEEMIENIQTAFGSLVDESNWMDEETKLLAREKAAAMKTFLAYPDWIRNKTALEMAYDKVNTSRNQHFENILSVLQLLVHEDLGTLRMPTDRSIWITYPSIVNAYYSSRFNSITFPAAILQPPFFGKGRLAAMNYGAIGVVIGHEITHGFDDEGRQSDKDGNTKSWWTNGTLSRYLDRAQCFIEQYGNYTFPQFAGTDFSNINGIISQGENIADNGGIREAFRAYKSHVMLNGPEPRLPGLEKYSPEQLFFISYANIWCGKQNSESLREQIANGPHSPNRYRVIGPLSNSQDFVKHFQCPTGIMNRPKKCILW